MAIVAVLGAAFSLREQEPNPCNVRLAQEVLRACDELRARGHMPVVAVQWEIDAALQSLGRTKTYDNVRSVFDDGAFPYMVIGQYDDGRYLGTREVLKEALPFFGDMGATHFVGVAQPYIHQPYLYWLARKSFRLIWIRTRRIGFDPDSTQQWCRSWWQLTKYTVKILITGSHGYDGRQAKA
ncbi:MAG: hypothetical protein WAV04_01110 [Candidatus Microsaccharimonas sp.]